MFARSCKHPITLFYAVVFCSVLTRIIVVSVSVFVCLLELGYLQLNSEVEFFCVLDFDFVCAFGLAVAT